MFQYRSVDIETDFGLLLFIRVRRLVLLNVVRDGAGALHVIFSEVLLDKLAVLAVANTRASAANLLADVFPGNPLVTFLLTLCTDAHEQLLFAFAPPSVVRALGAAV